MTRTDSRTDGTDTSTGQSRQIPWHFIAGTVLAVLVVAFLLENTKKVPIRFVGPQVQAPLVVALLVAAVLGSLSTLLLQRRRRNR